MTKYITRRISALQASRNRWRELATELSRELEAVKMERDALRRERNRWRDRTTELSRELTAVKVERDALSKQCSHFFKQINKIKGV